MDKAEVLKLLMNTLYYDLKEEDRGLRRFSFSKIINGEEIILVFIDHFSHFCNWEVRIEYPDNDLRVRSTTILYLRNLIRDIETTFPNKVIDMFH
jgi:hypothetical protein